MTDRDHFAAAALTGLLHHNHEPPKPVGWWVEQAYDYADAMLRERERTFDAKPRELSDDQRTLRNAAGLLGPGGFKNLANELLSLSRRLKNHDAAPAATAGTPGTGDTPATEKEKLAEVSDGSYQKTDENRGNCDTSRAEIASLREAIRRLADQDATLSVQDGNVTVTMDATLTPEEREAVETAALEADAHQHTQRAATLRGLLERLA